MKQFLFSGNRIFFSLFLISVFILVTGHTLMREGMFFDGLTYASISRNLAEGIGDYWHPHYTHTLYPQFYEHPPGTFWIQSAFFKVAGDHYFTEKIYCLICFMASALFISKIIRKIIGTKEGLSVFITLLLWMLIPVNFWAFSNNMLEITLLPVTLATIYTCLLAETSRPWFLFFLIGVLLFVCFMIKGFVGLFPLAFFPLQWYTCRKDSFLKTCLKTIFIALILGLLFYFIIVLNPQATGFRNYYFSRQVIDGITGNRVEQVSTRFFILIHLLLQLLPVILIGAGLFIYKSKKDMPAKWKKESILFLLLGLSASAPIMISIKQMEFYLVPSLPYFIIAFALYFHETLIMLGNQLQAWFSTAAKKLMIRLFVIALVLCSLGFVLLKRNTSFRDVKLIHDMKANETILLQNKFIGIDQAGITDWRLHAYMQRYYKVSLVESNDQELLLSTEIPDTSNIDVLGKIENYTLLKIK